MPSGRVVRSGPLLSARWPTRAGWDGGDSSLEIETGAASPGGAALPTSRSRRLSLPAPQPPPLLFRQHFEGAGALQGGRRVPGVLLPASAVHRPAGPWRAGRHSRRTPPTSPDSRPPPPFRDTHTRPPALWDARSESPDVSLQRLSPGTLSSGGHTLSHPHVHRCLPRLLQPTSSSAPQDAHTFVHTC